jgi:hypothetical protein
MNFDSDSDGPPQQMPARQPATLKAQIQQAVAAASRTTRYSSGGVPGEVVESIDLDMLQQELSAILSRS